MTAKSSVATQPYWIDSAALPRFPKLDRDEEVDVVVVGGGITGLTAAYLLTLDGCRVALLERERCAHIDTGHTTAHLTMVTDARLPELVKRFGRDHAQASWEAGLAAIGQIDAIVGDLEIACGFEWVPGYLHAPFARPSGTDESASLREEAMLATALGFDATFVEQVPLAGVPGIRFDGQARFHPRKYLAALARAVADRGGMIFEHSASDGFCDDPRSVTSNGYTLRCGDVVLATHTPLRRHRLLGQRHDVRHAVGHDGGRSDHGPREPVERAVRSVAQDARRPLGLRQGKQGLPVLSGPRSLRRDRGEIAAFRTAWIRQGARSERPGRGGLPRRARPGDEEGGGLHAHGL